MQKNMRYMKGQALVLFLGFAAALVGVLLISFNSGQVSNAKMRAMNAADASAYSGAVWHARSLNFQAYMNRAIIANEVTIAQSVSLRSWIDYLARFMNNVNTVTQFIPWVGNVTQAIARVMNQIDARTQDFLSRAEDGIRLLNFAEHRAQLGMTLFAAAGGRELAIEIARRNGAEVTTAGQVLLIANMRAMDAHTATYTRTNRTTIHPGSDGRRRLRDVALDSRDGFTEARDFRWGNIVGIRKYGGTDLIDYDAWKGMDASYFCVWRPFRGCRFAAPGGWGGAQAHNTRNPVGAIGRHGNNGEWNNLPGRGARLAAVGNPGANQLERWQTQGQFPDYRDIRNFDTRNPRANMLPFAVEVVVAERTIPTANSAFQGRAALTDGTTLEHDPQYVNNNRGVFALAESCVSFERPFDAPRDGGGREFPSLFNPYWRASMATEHWATRLAVDVAKGVRGPAALLSGRGSCR